MNPKLQGLLKLPLEMRQRDQWCVAAPGKEPYFISSTLQYKADVTNPKSWMSFAEAIKWAGIYNADIGYVLAADDPFTCIDLDVKDAENAPDKPNKWTTADKYDQFLQAIGQFNSFTERSRSGKGFHIWVKGVADRALKKDDIEVYSTERFIICTGNVIKDCGINDRQVLLNKFLEYYRGEDAAIEQEILKDKPEVEDDWSIMLRIHNSAQREKFERLWLGKFDDYPSQSEADSALLQILCYYSENNTQIGRMFLNSALGKRDKCRDGNYRYLRRSLARARSIRNREIRAEEAAIKQSQELRRNLQTGKSVDVAAQVAKMNAEAQPPSRMVAGVHAASVASVAPSLLSPGAEAAMGELVTPDILEVGKTGIPWPPGVMGQIARFIFKNSVRPVKEVCIVSAIGMMAGLCGKAWHIPQSGLNMYVVLVAKSAVGKEAMHTGISTILRTCVSDYGAEDLWEFFDYSEYQSGPALAKECAERASFLNVQGEWGKRLQRMSSNENDGPLASLRTQMTNLYQKSGPQSIMAGLTYSDREKNTASMAGVAYSMIGETTPQTYYDALTPRMMEDGFLSRFLMIEYTGKRVPMNLAQELKPSETLCKLIISIARQAKRNYADKDGSVAVPASEEARVLISNFELECDKRINCTDDESRRQMWNRASLKSIRLAALIAVGDNHIKPVMTKEHVEWAQNVILMDIKSMTSRLDNGDVGQGDAPRDRKFASVLKEYLASVPAKSYKIPMGMHSSSIVPRSYLQLRMSRQTSFTNSREGLRQSLDSCIKTALDNGYIMEVTRTALADNFNFQGKAYRIINIPNFEELDNIND